MNYEVGHCGGRGKLLMRCFFYLTLIFCLLLKLRGTVIKYLVIFSCSETKLYNITGMQALAELILYPQQLWSVSSIGLPLRKTTRRKDLRWRQCQCPVLEIFDYFVSSLCPETCPAMCQSACLSNRCQDTRAESTGLRLDAGNVVIGSWELDPACPDSGPGFMAWVQRCAKAAIQLCDQAAKPVEWLYRIT